MDYIDYSISHVNVTALYTILFILFHALLCHFVYHPLNEIHV